MIVYEGPSELNGEPIVGIITGLTVRSKNVKTGPMAQLWILDATEEPHHAVKSGQDASVCGDCPARNKWCYVVTFQGPLNIYRTWKAGGYPQYDRERLRGEKLRFGAYGDPAALPLGTVQELGRACDSFTGYTHQWRRCPSELQQYCMASVDSPRDYKEAVASGWRTFRVTAEPNDRFKGEVVCPATTVGLTCYDCGACDGRHRPRSKSGIIIEAHGARTKNYIEEFGNA